MGDLNRQFFLWVNHWPEMPFITFWSNALNMLWVKVLLGALVLFLLLRNAQTRAAVLLALVAVGIGNSLTDVAKRALPAHRPFQPQELGSEVILRVGYAESMGTASAHSANMAAVAVVMTLMLGRWGWPWIAVALLTGLSRIYTGAHYPWQVLFGYVIGGGMGWLVVATYRFVMARRLDKKNEAQSA